MAFLSLMSMKTINSDFSYLHSVLLVVSFIVTAMLIYFEKYKGLGEEVNHGTNSFENTHWSC